jgi:hypothetical protein
MLIPDPNFSIPDPGSKRFRIRVSCNPKTCFLSSQKYDPGCSSRIRIPDLCDFLLIPDPVVKGTGSRIGIRHTDLNATGTGELLENNTDTGLNFTLEQHTSAQNFFKATCRRLSQHLTFNSYETIT